MLDFKFFYRREQAVTAISSTGVNGQNIYVRLLIIDFIFIIYTAYFFTNRIIFLRQKFNLPKKYYKLSYLGIARSIFDGIENILLLIAILILPKLAMANVVTLLKWITIALYTISLLIIIIIGLVNGYKKKTT